MSEIGISQGSKVKLNYVLRSDGKEGDVLEETESPLHFTVGKGELLDSLEQALMGLKEGDKHAFLIPCDKAFGPLDDDLFLTMPKSAFVGEDNVEESRLEEGEIIMLTDDEDNDHPAMILEIGNTDVELDLNHPLAGEDLWYEVEILEVK